jgi:DnaK suppressor protein
MRNQEKIRQQLQNRYTQIGGGLDKITRDMRHEEEPLLADFAEQAAQRENDEVLSALDDSIRAEMRQIEQTLLRLEEGVYGICEMCEQPIGKPRLAALPYAVRCVSCEEGLEQR